MRFRVLDSYNFFSLWDKSHCVVRGGEIRTLLNCPEIMEQIEEDAERLIYDTVSQRDSVKGAVVEVPDYLLEKTVFFSEENIPVPGFYPGKGGVWCDLTIILGSKTALDDEEIKEAVRWFYETNGIPKSCYRYRVIRQEEEYPLISVPEEKAA